MKNPDKLTIFHGHKARAILKSNRESMPKPLFDFLSLLIARHPERETAARNEDRLQRLTAYFDEFIENHCEDQW